MHSSKIIHQTLVILLAISSISASAMLGPSKWSLTALRNYIIPSLKYPQRYSIHLMWINRSSSPEQPYIYPSTAEHNSGTKYSDTIIKWAKANPESMVTLWFDGALISDKAVQATREQLEREAQQHSIAISTINLRDIRQSQQVQEMAEFFSPEMPVFWRADFARVLVIKEELERNKDTCCVYADFDVTPLSKEELFDNQSLSNLEKHSFVMAHESNTLKFENGFQMFMHNEQLLQAMQDTLIEMNRGRARAFLQEMEERKQLTSIFSNEKIWLRHKTAFQENVFYAYPLMYTYLGQLRGLTTLRLTGKSKCYDPQHKELLDVDASILMAKSSALNYMSQFPIPTKKVSFPPSTSHQQELLRPEISTHDR